MKKIENDIVVKNIDTEIYPVIRLTFRKNDKFFGIGIDKLLSIIDRTNSIQSACNEMGMSYSKAWSIIRRAEKELGFKLLETHIGGQGGGNSYLTKEARDFMKKYDDMLEELNQYTEKVFKKYFGE